MSPTRTLLCAATRKGLAALEGLARGGEPSRFWITTHREPHTQDPVDGEIETRALDAGMNFVAWKDLREDVAGFAAQHRIDVVMAAGWRYLLPMEIHAATRHGLFILHDSLLPRHRGFAPLATAILCGDSNVGVTLLKGGATCDEGAIFDQRAIDLPARATIAQAIELVEPLYADLTAEFLAELDAGRTPKLTEQDHARATYSIWRAPEDARVDWTQPAEHIDRIVRAAGYPYSGAFTYLNGKRVGLHEVEPVEEVNFSVREPGKVWTLDGGQPTVVCGAGMLRIRHAAFEDGASLLPMTSLRQRFT